MVLSKGSTLSVETLPLASAGREAEVSHENISFQEAKKVVLESFERRFFTRILREAGGNVSQTARRAQIDRKNLYQKMKELRINPKDYQKGG